MSNIIRFTVFAQRTVSNIVVFTGIVVIFTGVYVAMASTKDILALFIIGSGATVILTGKFIPNIIRLIKRSNQ